MDLVQTAPNGLEQVNVATREQDPEFWSRSVKVIATILAEHQPRVILLPHDNDWNSSHIGTHHLVVDALKTLPLTFSCYAVETEFWGAMASPNLTVEVSPNDLADLIQNISTAARQQSAAATNISATMNVIQEITTQTSVGASQTAESIGNLAHLAADLRRSVADFKLPG